MNKNIHILQLLMADKNNYFIKTVKNIFIFCLYYNYLVLTLFYWIYFKAWYTLGVRPDLSAKDPKDIGFTNPILEKTSDLLPYIWSIIILYFLIFFIIKKNIVAVAKVHLTFFIISVLLFLLTFPLLIWYAD